MAAEPLIDLEAAKGWAPATESAKDDQLELAIQRASDWIESWAGRVIVAPTTAVSELVDGDGRQVRGKYRQMLVLSRHPVISITSIYENGVALSHATGYDTDADVILDPGSFTRHSRLHRRRTTAGTLAVPVAPEPWPGWSPGVQNIAITYRGGLEANAVPPRIAQLCVELTWLMHKESARLGRTNFSRAGMSNTYLKDLTPLSRATAEQLRSWGQLA